MLGVASGGCSSFNCKLHPSNGNLGMQHGIEGSESKTPGKKASGRVVVSDPVTYVEHGEEMS